MSNWGKRDKHENALQGRGLDIVSAGESFTDPVPSDRFPSHLPKLKRESQSSSHTFSTWHHPRQIYRMRGSQLL